MLAVKSRTVMALEGARALLKDEHSWRQVYDIAPAPCPIQAIVRSANRLDLGLWWRFRLILRLRDALPASHRRWWPECIIHYSDDPKVTHADVVALFDRAIEAAERNPGHA